MATRQINSVLKHIRRLAEEREACQWTDQQLLGRFINKKEEAAFTALVRRHGPMVLALGRRVLRNREDAQDVFQAAFLVLAQKARSIRKQESIGGWLYRVAFRLALRVRAEAAKRVRPTPSRPEASPADPVAEISWREVCLALDEELAVLPDRCREPLVLCYLESKTQDEALRQLGWSKSTFRRRLEEGRKRLCSRLTRRGITLSAGLWATLLSDQGASAALPSALSLATVQAAIPFAAGEIAGAAVSPQVILLAKEGLKAAVMSKMKWVALAGMIAALTTGIGLAAHQARKTNPATEARQELLALADEPRDQLKPEKANSARVDRYGDPLPEGAIARLGTVRFRHGSLIGSLTFTPDGKHLISHGDHHMSYGQDALRIWDTATGRELGHATVEPDDGIVSSFVTRDGKTVFTLERVRGEMSVRCRHRADLTVVRQFQVDNQFQVGHFQAARWSPDGKLLVGFLHPSTLEIWDMVEGKRLRSWKPHEDCVHAFEFSADGKTLVTGGQDKAIRFWDVATGQQKREITGHPKPVGKLALSTDGTLLATVGMNRELYLPWNNVARIWDVASGKVRHELTMPVKQQFGDGSLGFSNLAFAPDGKTLVTAGQDDMLRFWNVDTGKELRWISLGNRSYWGLRAAASLAFAPDGKTLAVGTNAIWLLDAVSGKDIRAFGSHRGGIYATATSDGTTVFTAGDEGVVVIWDTATGRERGRLEGKDQRITAIAVVDGGRRLLTDGIHMWDVTTNKELRWIRAPYAFRVSAPLAISPDERTLAGPGKDNGVALIDLETGKEQVSFGKHDAWVSGAAFHPDGRTLIVWCQDHTAHVWDLKTGRKLSQFEFAELQPVGPRPPPPPSGKGGRNGAGYAAVVSLDGRLIAYGSHWHYLAIHDVLTGKVVRLIDQLLPDGAGTLAFSPDGRTLAWSGWEQPTIHLLELATGKERHRFEGHKRRVTSLAFSADGKTLISGSEDTTAMVWDLSGKLLREKGPLDLDTAWQGLAGTDAASAYQAMRRLAALPTEAIPYLRNQVQPIPVLNEKRLAGLIADLDSNRFAVREKATKDLENLGEVAVGACRKALQGQPSAEVRRRLKALLEKEAKSASALSPERLRTLRAIEVLDHIGTPEAQRMLKSLAQGAPEARLTQEAKASLERLAKRTLVSP